MEEFATPDCDVLICDSRHKLLGTGVLLASEDLEYAFVLTAAHLFRNQENSLKEEAGLRIYSPFLGNPQCDKDKYGKSNKNGQMVEAVCSIHLPGDDIEGEEESVILIHSEYDPKIEQSSHDLAVIRIQKKEWMDGMETVRFADKIEEATPLCGHGYPVGTDGERLGKNGDVHKARTRFTCTCDKENIRTHEFKVTYLMPDTVDLHGYSGTGLFDRSQRLYGVLYRKAGNNEAPQNCFVSGWKGYKGLLEALGWKAPPETAEEGVTDIDLNVRGRWLLHPNGKYPNGKSGGLMDDRNAVNLASLLLGMTDAYTVILATTWRKGIALSLEKMLNEFADRNHSERGKLPFPKWREAPSPDAPVQAGEGVAVNLAASRQDILPRVEELLARYQKVPLIVNIWSERPAEALEAVADLYEKGLRGRADFLSVIGYEEKMDRGASRMTEAAADCLKQLKCKKINKKTALLLRYKEQDTGLWWNIIAQLAEEADAGENFIGYRIARSSGKAVQRWFEAHRGDGVEKLFTEDILYHLFEQEEIDDLAVYLWAYLRELADRESGGWEDCFAQVRDCCSEPRAALLAVLEGECEIRCMMDRLSPGDIQIWADLAEPADFAGSIGELSAANQAFYWIAVMRNRGGAEFVMRERLKRQNERLISQILNRVLGQDGDELIRERAPYIRSHIRVN